MRPSAASVLRWGRIVLGGFLAEVLLMVAVIPMYAAGAAGGWLAACASAPAATTARV